LLKPHDINDKKKQKQKSKWSLSLVSKNPKKKKPFWSDGGSFI